MDTVYATPSPSVRTPRWAPGGPGSERQSIRIDTAWATPQSSALTPSWAPGGPGSENTGFQLERQLELTRFQPPRRHPLGPQLGTWRPSPQKWRFSKGTLIAIDTVWATPPPDPRLGTWWPRLQKWRFSNKTSIRNDMVWDTSPSSAQKHLQVEANSNYKGEGCSSLRSRSISKDNAPPVPNSYRFHPFSTFF